MRALGRERGHEDEKVHLVGYSMGGYIAALLAQLKPQNIASITLIGYNPEGLTQDEISKRQQLTTMLKNGSFNPNNDPYLARFIHPSRLDDTNVVGVVKAMAQDLGKNTLLNHTLATTPRENTTQALAKINVPITFIAAQQDNIAPAASIKHTIKAIPRATLHELTDTGHMIPLEQVDALAAILAKQISV